MPAPAFRSSATATATATSVTVSRPSGVADGDFLLTCFYWLGSPPPDPPDVTVTPPSGWTLVLRTNGTAAEAHFMATYRKAASSEPADYTWTVSNSGDLMVAVLAYTGAITSSVDASGGQNNPTSSTAITAPSITTTVADTRLVFCGAGTSGLDPPTFTPPSGMTERTDINIVAAGTGQETADEERAATGATGTRVATATVSVTSAGQLIALAPSATFPGWGYQGGWW